MFRGSADEAVVVIKPDTEDGMVTCQRGKYPERDTEVKGEGLNMTSNDREHYYLRIADQPQGTGSRQRRIPLNKDGRERSRDTRTGGTWNN